MTHLEIGGAALGGVFTLAQVGNGEGAVETVLKGGAVAAVSALFYLFMRQHKETIEMLAKEHKEAIERVEKAHEDSSNAFTASTTRIVASLDRTSAAVDTMVRHCAEANARKPRNDN